MKPFSTVVIAPLTGLFLNSVSAAACAKRDFWKPAAGTTWQIVLGNQLEISTSKPSVTPDVAVYDIDLFENTDSLTDDSTIRALHSLGKKVICYFSAGSYEPGRPDSDQFPAADIGKVMEGWPNEKWVNVASDKIVAIMKARIAGAAKMGCDAVDPDNVDGYVSSPASLG